MKTTKVVDYTHQLYRVQLIWVIPYLCQRIRRIKPNTESVKKNRDLSPGTERKLETYHEMKNLSNKHTLKRSKSRAR